MEGLALASLGKEKVPTVLCNHSGDQNRNARLILRKVSPQKGTAQM